MPSNGIPVLKLIRSMSSPGVGIATSAAVRIRA
ncbi:hypothetical protein P3T29_006134 [Kitasatospora sp. MAP5-34]|nr:hypothetical protein [Kitasatospora sp. MAP5-34]